MVIILNRRTAFLPGVIPLVKMLFFYFIHYYKKWSRISGKETNWISKFLSQAWHV